MEEFGGVENAIVGVIVLDGDALCASESFESVLSFNSFGSVGSFMYVDIAQTRGVIHKNSGNAIALLGELADVLCDKSWDRRDHLVH